MTDLLNSRYGRFIAGLVAAFVIGAMEERAGELGLAPASA